MLKILDIFSLGMLISFMLIKKEGVSESKRSYNVNLIFNNITRFFISIYKLYKNTQYEIGQKIKNILRMFNTELFLGGNIFLHLSYYTVL